MPHHEVYSALVGAVKVGRLQEPFSVAGFREACPGFGEGTYRAFLWKHSSSQKGNTRLVEKVGPGRFRLLRPFLYGL